MALRRVRIQRIVCPTDFSEFAERALRRGVSLARWFDAQVIALHVIPAVPWAAPGAGWAAGILVPQDLLRPVREEVAGKLEDFVRPLRGQGIALETRLGEGDVAREIQALAEALPADLVVMGTHGRRGFSHLVLGSAAEGVIREATIPVLLVRLPQAAK